MLAKHVNDDGGPDLEMGLVGRAVFLDIWAVRELSRARHAELQNRFTTALLAVRGSLLVSSIWVTELDTLKGDARTRAMDFLSSLGAQWLLINPVVSAVLARQARNELGAYLSHEGALGYLKDRCGELLRATRNPLTVSDTEFFDLSRLLDWTAAEDTDDSSAPARQNVALKYAVMTRADADRKEQRRDPVAFQRLYPVINFLSSPMLCVHNALWREVTRRSLGRTWMANDGFDISHLIPALTIGGLIAVDSDWQDIGQSAIAELPGGHAKLYRPGELESLIAGLEALEDSVARHV
jgi:hypothetical protein